MVEREGIYVGNREISERYVGDKLVWGKWIKIGEVYGINAPKLHRRNQASVTIEVKRDDIFISHPRFNMEKTKQVKIVNNYNNRIFYARFVSLVDGYSEDSSAYSIGMGYYVVIDFITQEEAQQFVNSGNQNYTFYIR